MPNMLASCCSGVMLDGEGASAGTLFDLSSVGSAPALRFIRAINWASTLLGATAIGGAVCCGAGSGALAITVVVAEMGFA